MSYLKLVTEALSKTESRKGMSLPALKKYIAEEHADIKFQPHLLRSALKNGVTKDILKQDKAHYRLTPTVKVVKKRPAKIAKEIPEEKEMAAEKKVNVKKLQLKRRHRCRKKETAKRKCRPTSPSE